MITRSKYRLIGFALFLLISVLLPESARSEKTIVPGSSTASVTQDPDQWRREPFIVNLNKGASLNNAKTTSLTQPAKRLKTIDEQALLLQGIIQSDKSYHALINGRTVKAGDVISGMTIKEISRFRIVALNGRKEKITYDIYQGRID